MRFFLDLKEIEKQVCNVDGKVYQGGETFSPKYNPKLECYCMPGYTGIVCYKKIINSYTVDAIHSNLQEEVAIYVNESDIFSFVYQWILFFIM